MVLMEEMVVSDFAIVYDFVKTLPNGVGEFFVGRFPVVLGLLALVYFVWLVSQESWIQKLWSRIEDSLGSASMESSVEKLIPDRFRLHVDWFFILASFIVVLVSILGVFAFGDLAFKVLLYNGSAGAFSGFVFLMSISVYFTYMAFVFVRFANQMAERIMNR